MIPGCSVCPKCGYGVWNLAAHLDTNPCIVRAARQTALQRGLKSIDGLNVGKLLAQAGFRVVRLPTIHIKSVRSELKYLPFAEAIAADLVRLTKAMPRRRRLQALKLLKQGSTSAALAIRGAVSFHDVDLVNTIIDANRR